MAMSTLPHARDRCNKDGYNTDAMIAQKNSSNEEKSFLGMSLRTKRRENDVFPSDSTVDNYSIDLDVLNKDTKTVDNGYYLNSASDAFYALFSRDADGREFRARLTLFYGLISMAVPIIVLHNVFHLERHASFFIGKYIYSENIFVRVNACLAS